MAWSRFALQSVLILFVIDKRYANSYLIRTPMFSFDNVLVTCVQNQKSFLMGQNDRFFWAFPPSQRHSRHPPMRHAVFKPLIVCRDKNSPGGGDEYRSNRTIKSSFVDSVEALVKYRRHASTFKEVIF